MSELALMAITFVAIAFTAYWTGRRHGEADRHALLDELDFQQDLINDLADALGPSGNHPALRAVQD
jgi:cbb3-type cytochrome oxidase subunit 3